MTSSNTATETTTLIRTKLYMSRLGGELIERLRLVDQLNQDLARKLTRISALAGLYECTGQKLYKALYLSTALW